MRIHTHTPLGIWEENCLKKVTDLIILLTKHDFLLNFQVFLDIKPLIKINQYFLFEQWEEILT